MSSELDEQPIEFIRLPEVRKLTGLSTSTIYRMAVGGKFPRQVKLGDQAVAWVKSEVLAWNQQKVDDARASESPMGSVRTTIGNNSP